VRHPRSVVGVTGAPAILIGSAVAIASLMLATWGVSLAVRDASIVDIAWGAGFVLVAWVARWLGGSDAPHAWLLPVLATVWGARLALHLARRNLGKGEDFRYVRMREKHGDRFALVSLGTVFGVQGALMWVVSLPLQLGQRPSDRGVGVLAVLGVVAWAVGLWFEAVGDWQLARFRRDPANAGRVLDTGLWAWTRHPNYFGDACVWWGLALVAAARPARRAGDERVARARLGRRAPRAQPAPVQARLGRLRGADLGLHSPSAATVRPGS